MRSFCAITLALLFLLGCKRANTPNAENFMNAINGYFAQHGEVCTAIGRQFPVDVPMSQHDGIGAQLSVLESAGLLQATRTTAVIHGMFGALRRSTRPQPVTRYELSEEGKRYFQTFPGTLGRTTGFCYGQKSVASIVNWTAPVPVGGFTQTEVTYTYKIVDLPAWAARVDVQQAFPDIGTMVRGQSKLNEIAGMQLTNHGWEVATQ